MLLIFLSNDYIFFLNELFEVLKTLSNFSNAIQIKPKERGGGGRGEEILVFLFAWP
jgi:hypothetical protein